MSASSLYDTYSQANHRQRLQKFAACLDRWAEEADQSSVPPYIHAIISTPARDIDSTSCPLRVNANATLLNVLEVFQDVRTVIVHPDSSGDQKVTSGELLLNRLVFVEHALAATSMSDPLSSILDAVPALGWVQGHETLDVVLQRMLATGFEEVGVLEGGIVTGVLHVDDVFKFLSRELALLGFAPPSRLDTNQIFEGRDETEQTLFVETSADVKQRIDRQKKQQFMSPLQLFAQQFCKAYWTEFLIILCILLDVCCSVYVYQTSQLTDDDIAEQKLSVLTGIILFIFLYEAFVRVFGFRTALLRLPFEMIDLLIVVISVVVYVMVLQSVVSVESKSLVTLTRIIRGLRMFKMVKLIVGIIVKQRMLYNRDGFALDLSFITKSCIAMSVPAVGSQANFANPIEEVSRFFNTKFPDRYLVFNLCSKSTYNADYFGGRVERIMVEKHNPPRMSQMVAFVERAGKLMDDDPKACIAVHCRSGRDRTGVMVSAWLLYSTFAESADDAMQWFASRRVQKRASVGAAISMASQQRYVRYMEEALRLGGYYTKRLLLTRLTVKTCPMMDADRGCLLWLTVDEEGRELYRSVGRGSNPVSKMAMSDQELVFDLDLLVAGDLRITFYNREPSVSRDELCFYLCFHTGFVRSPEEVFPKEAVDIASSDARCKVFSADFAVHVTFDCVPNPGSILSADVIQRGTALGPFRKIIRPTQRVADAAVRMRGRDLKVQRQSAMRLKKMVHSALSDARQGEAAAAEPPSDAEAKASLCCAGGPAVQHDSVDLFQSDEYNVSMNRHGSLRGTFSASKYISQTLGAKIARSLVSGNKRRFVEDGFDLDLSYITARVIAMGFPSSGIERSYRNSKEDVYRFFQERHAAHYRIVNLCSERAYSLDTFHGNCVRYPFPDHNPPALELILPCCAHIHKYLQADPDNVIAIHCKAGKGRTGLIVVAYLMYCGLKGSALEARSFYDWARTTDGKGLTITSQIRYAHYFEQLLRLIKEGHEPLETAQDVAPAVVLHRFRLHTIPHFNSDASCCPSLTIAVKSELDHEEYPVYRSPRLAGDTTPGGLATSRGESAKAEFMDLSAADPRGGVDEAGAASAGTRVAGDFKVTFKDESKGKTMFFFTLHTALLTRPPSEMGGRARQLTEAESAAEGLVPAGGDSIWSLVLSKHEIDRAAKDSRCAHFDPDFKCEIFFSELPGQTGTGPALDTARAEALQLDPAAGPRERPLQRDREAHAAAANAAAAGGQPIQSFEAWLLDWNPGTSEQGGLSSRSPSLRSALTGSGSNVIPMRAASSAPPRLTALRDGGAHISRLASHNGVLQGAGRGREANPPLAAPAALPVSSQAVEEVVQVHLA